MVNMIPGSNPYQQYKKNAVETATPEKLLLMLFDAAIKFLIQGQMGIEQKNFEAANKSLLRVQDIFSELITSLDMEKGAELAENLQKLYDFYRSEVIQANISKDANRLGSVLEFLHLYRSVWAEAANISRQAAK